MKKVLIIVIIASILVVCFLLAKYLLSKKTAKVGSIQSFNYFYTSGYAMNADIRYKFLYDAKDNKYLITKKGLYKDEDNSKTIEVDKEFYDKLESIIKKYNVNSWDGFSGSNKDVLDGDSFSLYIQYNIGSVSASGYMKWPKNYREFKSEIMELYDPYFVNYDKENY